MTTIMNEGRVRLRTDLVRRLRELAPEIGREQHALEHLIDEYNRLLAQVRRLQDALLDDLEEAQDRGEGLGAVDYAHYFWTRADFAAYDLPDVFCLDDADRLERLPADV